MLFHFLVVLAEVLGIGICAMMGSWFGHYQNGFAWRENPKVEFSYHPLFMSIGLLFLYGNGIILYRVFPKTTKLYVKIAHTAIHLGAIVFSVVGVVAAFDSHNLRENPIGNMYSLHSWVGIATVAMFCIQWVMGLSAYLLPNVVPVFLKKIYMPHHVFWGLALFGLSAAASLMGIVERTILQITRINYLKIGTESSIINCMGVLLAMYTVIIIYLGVKPEWKRDQPPPPQPEQGKA